MSRIGLLFGSFNPVHNGHLVVAEAALAAGINDVWFVVQARNPYKATTRDVPAFQHRKAMADLAVRDHRRVHVWETQQSPPHIVSSLLELRSQEPRHSYVLIMGQDLVDSLPQWADYKEIMATAEILCYPRGGTSASFKHSKIHVLPTKPITISSGLIRERLAEGKQISQLTPLSVVRYIKENKLYT